MQEALEKLSKPELIEIILRQEKRLAELEAEVARLRKNSSTSSKPPSSDVVKPPKPPQRSKGRRRKRKAGGQPGHPRHERPAFGPDEVDVVQDYLPDRCPDCGGKMTPTGQPPRVIQQIELDPKPIRITEHRAFEGRCRQCGKVHYAAVPPEVARGGLIGIRLTAFIAFLKGVGHVSYTTLQTILRDVLGITLSTGHLAKIIGKASAALETPYQDLMDRLPDEGLLNVDETGHKERGESFWTWVFRARLFTVFKIDPSRGSEVLLRVLGEAFDGVLGCDYFSAYRKYMKDFDVRVQFCLAHLIRDVKYLTTLPDPVTRRYGERLLKALRALFAVIHRREQYVTPAAFERALDRARRNVLAVGRRAPRRSEAQNLAERFRQHGPAYFQFITTPGIDPTNNLAEQAIRFVVIDRRVTQGTRSEAGRAWCERIWTTIVTCTQQGRSVFAYLQQAVHAHLSGTAAPSLLLDAA
jgi:transposase